MTHPLTPSQTVGPYFGIAMTPPSAAVLVPEGSAKSIVLTGQVTDGAGNAVPEAMIEIWQADTDGEYPTAVIGADEGFTGFGRCHTDDEGRYRFITVKPGPVAGPNDDRQAPHINMTIFGGGLLKPLRTRVYFSDEDELNRADLVLSAVDEGRRHLLIGHVDGNTVNHDIRLQGGPETPFFEV